MRKWIVAAALCIGVSACAPQSQYHWGGYSSSLYDYYQDPTKIVEYHAALVAVVDDAPPGKTIPPGILAELGYLELQAGNTDVAITYFQREKHQWPEATAFMDRIIASIDETPVGEKPVGEKPVGEKPAGTDATKGAAPKPTKSVGS
jgi:hypothetical protein